MEWCATAGKYWILEQNQAEIGPKMDITQIRLCIMNYDLPSQEF